MTIGVTIDGTHLTIDTDEPFFVSVLQPSSMAIVGIIGIKPNGDRRGERQQGIGDRHEGN